MLKCDPDVFLTGFVSFAHVSCAARDSESYHILTHTAFLCHFTVDSCMQHLSSEALLWIGAEAPTVIMAFRLNGFKSTHTDKCCETLDCVVSERGSFCCKPSRRLSDSLYSVSLSLWMKLIHVVCCSTVYAVYIYTIHSGILVYCILCNIYCMLPNDDICILKFAHYSIYIRLKRLGSVRFFSLVFLKEVSSKAAFFWSKIQ